MGVNEKGLVAFGAKIKATGEKLQDEVHNEFNSDVLAAIELANPRLVPMHDMQLGLKLLQCGVNLMFRAGVRCIESEEEADVASDYILGLARAKVEQEMAESAIYMLKKFLGLTP